MSLTSVSSVVSRDPEDMLPGATPLKGKARKVTVSQICNNCISYQ